MFSLRRPPQPGMGGVGTVGTAASEYLNMQIPSTHACAPTRSQAHSHTDDENANSALKPFRMYPSYRTHHVDRLVSV